MMREDRLFVWGVAGIVGFTLLVLRLWALRNELI